jgi:hypothetical protein
VRFEINTDLGRISECNCSICTKKGALHHRVPYADFRLLSGEDALSLYQFGTRTAKHLFCRHCAIHSFSTPRIAPDMYSVNVRCLDEFPDALAATETTVFDGKNW